MERCPICEWPLNTKSELETHIEIKHPKTIECPVNPPKLLKANALVETCASCGAWVERYPAFIGDNDGFGECDKCGSTSTKIRDGRSYGPKSKEWDRIVELFNELYLNIPKFDWDTIVTDPPMKDLDWRAVEEWFRSQHIYRGFISIELMQANDR